MTRYAKRKLKYSLNENFNLLPYVEWDRFVTLSGALRNEGYVIVSKNAATGVEIRRFFPPYCWSPTKITPSSTK